MYVFFALSLSTYIYIYAYAYIYIYMYFSFFDPAGLPYKYLVFAPEVDR